MLTTLNLISQNFREAGPSTVDYNDEPISILGVILFIFILFVIFKISSSFTSWVDKTNEVEKEERKKQYAINNKNRNEIIRDGGIYNEYKNGKLVS